MADDRGVDPRLGPGVGLDVGSSLAKLCLVEADDPDYAIFPVDAAAAIETRVRSVTHGPLAITGAGASRWCDRFADRAPVLVSEFQATAAGVRLTLARHGLDVPEPYLVAAIGTGTSILLVGGARIERVGGTALGGGTLMGLGQLLCGTGEYAALTALAAEGNRQAVDLLVRDVYPDGLESLPGELTAASFGRIRSTDPRDLANALCGLLGENLGLLCGGLARLHGAATVLYCGTALLDNPALGNILVATTYYAGAAGQLLPEGAYCGALGALGHAGC